MTIQDVLNNTQLNGFSAADEAAIEAALTALYAGSATAQAMLDEIIVQSQTLVIDYTASAFQAIVGQFTLEIDLTMLNTLAYISPTGQAISYPLTLAIAHELVHAIYSHTDSLTPPDFAGATVAFTNTIHAEMGFGDRLSYHGIGIASEQVIAGTNYTNGATIDVAIVMARVGGYSGTYDADTEGHSTNSRDLLIGLDSITTPDTISGSTGNDFLYGYAGDDALNGEDGDDLLVGGAGSDDMDGGNDTDTLSYSANTSGVIVNLTTNIVSGGEAAGDTIANCENAIGSAYVDTLTGSSGVNDIQGGDDDDTIIGGGGATDVLNGGNGADTLSYTGSASGVTVNLATGSTSGGDAAGDTIASFENLTGSSHVDSLTGSTGNNTITGGVGGDTLNGGAGADTLDGGDDIDTLNGDAGNDTIIGGAGGDTLNGGGDTDTLSYAGSNAAVTVNLNTGGASGGHAASDSISSFENLTGSDHDDKLTGNLSVNVIFGGAGNDTIDGRGSGDTLDGGDGTDRLSYLSSGTGVTVNLDTGAASGGSAFGDSFSNFEDLMGTDFADTLTGSSGDNLLIGQDGVDTISGLGGNDTILGGAGGDTLNGGNDTDTVSYEASGAGVTVNINTNTASGGHAASDTISNFENITGSDHNDTLTGNAAGNVLSSLAGADTLSGLGGADTLNGGNGNDTLNGGTGNDTLNGGNGNDDLFGDDDSDTLSGGDDDDELDGGAGTDTLSGGDGADYLYGNGDVDTLDGGNQNDTIRGGTGAVILTGGAGADTFLYLFLISSGVGSGNRDIITDWANGADKIDVRDLADSFIGTGAFTGLGGSEVRYGTSGSDTIVEMDSDADTVVDWQIQLTGNYTLQGSDFLI